MRREPMIWLVRAFDRGTVGEEIDDIAVLLRPKGGASTLCCVYHDPAVIKYRLMALIGFSGEEETDELKRLSEYYAEKVAGKTAPSGEAPLTVCGPMCSGCPAVKIIALTVPELENRIRTLQGAILFC